VTAGLSRPSGGVLVDDEKSKLPDKQIFKGLKLRSLQSGNNSGVEQNGLCNGNEQTASELLYA
jgi:hypothetical protein